MHSLPDLGISLPQGTLGPLGNSRSTRSNTKLKVSVIIGVTFGSLGGLILLFGVLFVLRQRRMRTSAQIGSDVAEQEPEGPSTIVPFTDRFRPHMTNGFQVEDRNVKSRPTATGIVAGESSGRDGVNTTPGHDGNLRHEVEQLRRRVDMLSVQPPGVVYQQDSLPDEPPPMYDY